MRLIRKILLAAALCLAAPALFAAALCPSAAQFNDMDLVLERDGVQVWGGYMRTSRYETLMLVHARVGSNYASIMRGAQAAKLHCGHIPARIDVCVYRGPRLNDELGCSDIVFESGKVALHRSTPGLRANMAYAIIGERTDTERQRQASALFKPMLKPSP